MSNLNQNKSVWPDVQLHICIFSMIINVRKGLEHHIRFANLDDEFSNLYSRIIFFYYVLYTKSTGKNVP